MDNSTNNLIQEQFNSLPTEVKEALARVPWKDRIHDIAKREGLSADQSDSLETETMLMLYGFVTPDSFTGNITTEVGIDGEQAERIQKLVTDEIVADIESQFEMIDALEPRDTTPKMPEPPEPTPTAPQPATDSGLLNIPPEIMAKQIKMPSEPVDKLPIAAPSDLPEVVPGQAVHDARPLTPERSDGGRAPHVESQAPVRAPAPIEAPTAPPSPQAAKEQAKSIVEEKLSQVVSAPAYPAGKDPYREPLE